MNNIAQKQLLSDFQSIKFFQQCKQQLHQMAKQTKENRLQRKIAKMQKAVSEKQLKSQEMDRMYMNNIIIDYLRSVGYNYTYAVMMRESKIIAEDLVGKKKLAMLVGLEEQYNRDQRMDVSIIELLLNHHHKATPKKQYRQTYTQVQLISKTGEQNNRVILESKIRQVRQEVQNRERKYYEKQLEGIRSKEIMELRVEINRELEERYNKQKEKINKRYQEIVQKLKKSDQLSKYKQQNQSTMNKNYQLNIQVQKLKFRVQQLQKQKIKHDCTKSEVFKKLNSKLSQQYKELQIKKQQFDYAIRNVGTNVQELMQQKKIIEQQLQSKNGHTDKFFNQMKTNKKNKQYMIQSLYSEMKQLDSRVRVLSQDNNKLRNSISELKLQIRSKQQQIVRIRQQSSGYDSYNMDIQVDSIIKGLDIISKQGDAKSDNIIGKQVKMPKNHKSSIQAPNMADNSNPANKYKISPSSYQPDYRPQPLIQPASMAFINKKQAPSKPYTCIQCKNNKKNPYNNKMMNACVGVTEQDLSSQLEGNLHERDRENLTQSGVNSEADFEGKMQFQLDHQMKLNKLRADLNMVKNKIKILVTNDYFDP